MAILTIRNPIVLTACDPIKRRFNHDYQISHGEGRKIIKLRHQQAAQVQIRWHIKKIHLKHGCKERQTTVETCLKSGVRKLRDWGQRLAKLTAERQAHSKAAFDQGLDRLVDHRQIKPRAFGRQLTGQRFVGIGRRGCRASKNNARVLGNETKAPKAACI